MADRCILRRAYGKEVCLACPLIECFFDKEGRLSDIERELLILRKLELKGKVYNGKEWVAKPKGE